MHYDKREKLRCLVRGKKKFPVITDERVTFNIKGRCDFDQDFVQVRLFRFPSVMFVSSWFSKHKNGLRFCNFAPEEPERSC